MTTQFSSYLDVLIDIVAVNGGALSIDNNFSNAALITMTCSDGIKYAATGTNIEDAATSIVGALIADDYIDGDDIPAPGEYDGYPQCDKCGRPITNEPHEAYSSGGMFIACDSCNQILLNLLSRLVVNPDKNIPPLTTRKAAEDFAVDVFFTAVN